MYVGKERRNRVVALALAIALVAGLVLALVATVAGATPAGAAPVVPPALLPGHATLVSVVPANGALLDAAPSSIVLTFDDAVSPDLAQVVVTRDGHPVEVAAPRVDQREVTVAVTGQGGPGAYRIAWRMTSDDGHPVSGESGFGVGAAGGSRPQVTPTYKTPQMQPTTFGHPDHLPGLVVAGVLLLGGVGLLVYENRRRRHEDQPIS